MRQRKVPTTTGAPDDARTWLRRNGHERIVRLIDQLMEKWRLAGKKTRRNWWEILAGNQSGHSRIVDGEVFPVFAAAQRREGRTVAKAKQAKPAKQDQKAPKPRRRPGATAKVVFRRVDKRPRAAAVTETPPSVPRARPFVKWAGGKRQLLGEIVARLPKEFGAFHEPFVGGGAVFFAVEPARAVLSDMNERLIRSYRGIKHDVDGVIEILKTYRNNKAFFLKARKRSIDAGSDAEVAAWFIFLNKTAFNGLYRVNSKNQFNVPFGANASARICDEANLRACAAALANAELKCEDFSAVLDRAQPGDVVYFDPPYVPLSVTSSFTSYTSQGFDMKDQARLRDVALELRRRGVFVLVSNSSAPAVRELYQADFECADVSAFRLVNSNVKARGRITELLIK
jgi:DNA adenine methylase